MQWSRGTPRNLCWGEGPWTACTPSNTLQIPSLRLHSLATSGSSHGPCFTIPRWCYTCMHLNNWTLSLGRSMLAPKRPMIGVPFIQTSSRVKCGLLGTTICLCLTAGGWFSLHRSSWAKLSYTSVQFTNITGPNFPVHITGHRVAKLLLCTGHQSLQDWIPIQPLTDSVTAFLRV